MNNFRKNKNYRYSSYALTPVKAMISNTYLSKLREYSKQLRAPMSLLIARAIKNEFACENPFEGPVFDLPKLKPFSEETASTLHTQKLFSFIEKFPGASLEQLVMCREEMDIDTDELLVHCYNILRTVEMIVEEYPSQSKFNYPDDYRTVRIKQDNKLIRDKITSGRRKKLDYEKSPLHEVDDET